MSHSTKLSVAFIICSEKGLLEKKSLLFVKSLRKFGGQLKDAPVYSLAPRKGKDISHETKLAYEQLNVTHLHIDLNKDYKSYSFANKIVTSTYFENRLEEEILIFSDSDQLILGNLSELILKTSENVAMQHVAIKGIGSNGMDENADYWQELYDTLGVKKQSLIQLSDRSKILPYFNAGLIVARRKLGLFKQWGANFDLVMNAQLKPKKGVFFIEQSVLSATISAMEFSVKILPKAYNFHLLKVTKLDEAFQKIIVKKIKMLHYHTSFDAPNQLELPNQLSVSQEGSILKWINDNLIESGINQKPFVTELEKQFNSKKEDLKAIFEKQQQHLK